MLHYQLLAVNIAKWKRTILTEIFGADIIPLLPIHCICRKIVISQGFS